MLFPGDLLHGVLPCMDHDPKGDSETDTSAHGDNDGNDEPHHRLTLMVNFWAYRIPDRIQKRPLYGQSGPFPPVDDPDHSWTRDICQSYPRTVSLSPQLTIDPAPDGLVAASPAWEDLGPQKDDDCPFALQLPASGGINQQVSFGCNLGWCRNDCRRSQD